MGAVSANAPKAPVTSAAGYAPRAKTTFFLPAAYGVMSAEIAGSNFSQ